MSKTSSTNLEETVSKQQFFIDLYKANVDTAIIESFKDNVIFFEGLGCNILYKRKYNKDMVNYFIDPQVKEHGTIGYQYNNKR